MSEPFRLALLRAVEPTDLPLCLAYKRGLSTEGGFEF